MTATGQELLDVHEAAALVGRAPETVRRWVWTGRLPAQRRGRKLLVERRDVLALAALGSRGGMSLAGWRKQAVQHLQQTSREGITSSSAADLILADRRARDGANASDDARR